MNPSTGAIAELTTIDQFDDWTFESFGMPLLNGSMIIRYGDNYNDLVAINPLTGREGHATTPQWQHTVGCVVGLENENIYCLYSTWRSVEDWGGKMWTRTGPQALDFIVIKYAFRGDLLDPVS